MRLNKIEKRWFEFENDPDGGAVLIEHIEDAEMHEIFEGTVENEITYPPGESAPKVISRANMPKRRRMILTRAVRDWKHHNDANGKPLEFNEANLLLFASKTDGYNEAIETFRERLKHDVLAERKALEKN